MRTNKPSIARKVIDNAVVLLLFAAFGITLYNTVLGLFVYEAEFLLGFLIGGLLRAAMEFYIAWVFLFARIVPGES
jgi:hypothetical protein